MATKKPAIGIEKHLAAELFDSAKAGVRTFLSSGAVEAAAASAFGVSAADLAAAVQTLDRDDWPKLVLVDDDVLLGARAAYDPTRDTIYLSRDFLTDSAPAAVTAVLIQEIGHAIDARVHRTDAPGDEGAIFAQFVLGSPPTATELAALQAKNDHGSIVHHGKTVAVEFAAPVAGSSTLDGNLADWTSADQIDKSLSASGYDIYAKQSGGYYVFALKAPIAVGATTTAWLNTDQNAATGYKIWGWAGGAEYNVNFDSTGTPRLYTGADGQTLVSGATILYGYSADRMVVEFAVASSAIGSPTAINTLWDINNNTFLPTDFSATQYTVSGTALPPPQTIGSITLDGNLADWTTADQVDNTLSVSGYDIYAKATNGYYAFAVTAPVAIGATTTAWLNTDRNAATGHKIWGWAGGAEYNINFDAAGTPRLYTGADGQTLVSSAVPFAYSADRMTVEFAVASSAIGSPAAINTLWDINNNVFLPTDYSATQYTITASAPPPNGAPTITSAGGGDTATVSVAENSTAITTVTASDPDAGQTLTYFIIGGTDQALFQISSTGVLTFKTARDFEVPADSDRNNSYVVQVRVADNGSPSLADTQTITVNVADRNDNAPVITTATTRSVAENTTLAAVLTSTDADTVGTKPATFSITGGADAARFAISGGNLVFTSAPDFESPTDADRNNSYIVQVSASDGANVASKVITVDVTNVADTAVNQPPTFTVGDGKVTATVGSPLNFGNALAVQPDNKILVAGDASVGNSRHFALVRFNSDGSLDTTFDGDGKVSTAFGAGEAFGNSVALRDGKIIVAGYNFSTAGTAEDFAVARYNADGTLDTTFDSDGRVTTDFGGNTDVGRSVAIQADGKIVVAGESRIGFNYDFGVARYNTNGSLDTTFDGDGRVRTDFGGDADIAWTLAVQADGKIVVAGSGGGPFQLARYNANGSLDSSFDGDGKVATTVGGPNSGFLRSMVLQPDGKIVVAGEAFNGQPDTDVVVLRYNANGTLDTSFGSGGIVFSGVPILSDGANDVVLQPDGKIIVAGYVSGAAGADFFLMRLNPNGTIDGALTTDFGSVAESAKAVELQADGKIVVAGWSADSFAVARYSRDGSLDPAFDPIKVNTLNGSPTYASGGAAVVLDNDVRAYDPDLATLGNYAGATLTLARSGGANSQDVFSATGDLAALTQGAALVYDGVTVGTVTTNSAGRLGLTFNSNATQGYVDEVLQSIAYANNSTTPPPSVQINWTFSDENTVAQGSGGALGASGSTLVTISSAAANRPPLITSNGGADTATIAVNENTTTVTTVTASDPDAGQVLTYSIVGGGDQALFQISPAGVLTFRTARDFEVPADSDRNNSYVVQVRIADNGSPSLADTQTITVNVRDVNDNAPVITTAATLSLAENTTNVAALTSTDPDTVGTKPATFSITGGADAARFAISGGNLVFTSAPDFENPTDADRNNSYIVQVSASDGANVTNKTITVNVTDVADMTNRPPVITSNGGGDTASVSRAENSTAVTTVTATDSDAGQTITYFISGGADAALFAINASTGALTFKSPPDYEAPADQGANNVYNVTVGARDSSGGLDTQALAITVTNVNGITLNGDNNANTLTGTPEPDTIFGNGGNDTLYGLGGNDVLYGGAGNNLLDGGPGADHLQGGPANDAFIWDPADTWIAGGGGIDTLRITGAGVTLDLTQAVSRNAIDGIGIIDLTGSGDNTAVLSVNEIYTMCWDNVLRIDGNAGDRVMVLDASEWTVGADRAIGANTYRVWTQWGAELLIDTDVAINPQIGAAGAIPAANLVSLTGNANIDGLTQGSAWLFPNSAPRVITYSLSLSDAPDARSWQTSPLYSQIYDVLQAWSNVANITFVERGSGTVFTSSTADIAITLATNELQPAGIAAFSIFPDPAFADTFISAAGYTRAQYPRPEGDIFLDDASPAFSYGASHGTLGLKAVLHEIGHALGLKHTDDDGANGRPTFAQLGIASYDNPRYTLMGQTPAGTDAFSGHPATPMLLDILAVQQIYGANTSYNTGDDTYYWYESMQTIWDAGGNDTIDSPYARSATIDLRPGALSVSGERVIAIAHGVTVENAIGGDFDDTIIGNDADNGIDGRGGADRMEGGRGNDAYSVDNAGDVVIERAGEGRDTVFSTISYTLPQNVEVLWLTQGTHGTGNGLDNEIYGNSFAANVLVGNAGNDLLDGQGGGNWPGDTLRGGPGNDTYIVRSAKDSVIELAGEGSDTVRIWGEFGTSYTLPANVENLEVLGGVLFTGIGNALDNVMTGSVGPETLDGGAGNDVLVGGFDSDTLTGGAGSDRFDYNSYWDGLDTITDFTRGAGGDRLDIKDVLVGYTPGVSNINNFVRLSGTTSTTLSVNVDGAGTDFFALATLTSVAMTPTLLSEMLAQGNLIV